MNIKFVSPFIKSKTEFNSQDNAQFPSPIFRRRFLLKDTKNAILQICCLGYGYCYINGKKITEDLFTAPLSEYDKMVWYNEYNVSHLLKKGENVIAIILGNGFFNENFNTVWDTNKFPWRDQPKFSLCLSINGKKVLESDESFVYTEYSFVTYNQLRSGETFDARIYDSNWKELYFDDSKFENAIIDNKTIDIKRYLCNCEPIREIEEYDFISCKKTDEGYLLDFGVNISGYLRININEPCGTEIKLSHAEEVYSDGRLKLNRTDIYQNVPFQVDRYICGDKPYIWSPKFTYHGFRFALISGINNPPENSEIKAVFVHQNIRKITSFNSSDSLLNKIYEAGIRTSYSNLFYILTDCPTREKLGWTNDAQASIEQLYMNFDIKKFFEKWEKDICINMSDDGSLNAVIPNYGNFYHCGPVADGLLYHLPMLDYLYTGDNSMLLRMLPYIEKHYKFFRKRTVDYSLGDWDGHTNRFKDNDFIFNFYNIKICDCIIFGKKQSDKKGYDKYLLERQNSINWIIHNYILENGFSKVETQTVISVLLSISEIKKEPLLEQLKRCIASDNYHITCGMWGLQYIYGALFENGLGDLAYKMISIKEKPSFNHWFQNGATTIWETWEDGNTDSRNHHMLSGVLAWLFKGFLGIYPDIENPGYKHIKLIPCFASEIDYCDGSIETPFGRLTVSWEREKRLIKYRVIVPKGIKAIYEGRILNTGENIIFCRC